MTKTAQPIQWPGAGDHAGHLVTATDSWSNHLTLRSDGRMHLTCGRVRCSCGTEWNVGGWPPEVFDLICSPVGAS